MKTDSSVNRGKIAPYYQTSILHSHKSLTLWYSGIMLARETTFVKNEATGINSQIGNIQRRPIFWDIRPVSLHKFDV